MLVFFTNLIVVEVQVRYMAFFVFSQQGWLQVVLDGKFSQEYSVIARVHQGSILRPTLFLLCINELPDDVICTSAICADDTTHYSKCDQASDLWEQLGLVSELESGLQDIVDCFRKRTVDFIAEKTQLVSFDHSNMKMRVCS